MTTTTAATEFGGLPVVGDIIYGDEQDEQRPIEEFFERMVAVLADPDVKAIHWAQYTPYFNDGEPCTFNTHEVTVTLNSQPDPDGGPWERGYSLGSPELRGGYKREYNSTTRRWEQVGDGLPQHSVYQAFNAFASGFGAHQVDLLKAFGDHAEVTVTRDRITVDRVDHD